MPSSFALFAGRRRTGRAVALLLCGAVGALATGLPAQAQTAAAPAKTPAAASPMPGPRVQRLSKCTGANGRVTYSDSACPTGTRGEALQVEPDSNVVATTPLPVRAPSPATFEPPPTPAIAPQPYLPPPPNAGMPASQAADCAALDRRAATLYGRAQQPPSADNPQLLPNEQRSVEDLRQHLGCE